MLLSPTLDTKCSNSRFFTSGVRVESLHVRIIRASMRRAAILPKLFFAFCGSILHSNLCAKVLSNWRSCIGNETGTLRPRDVPNLNFYFETTSEQASHRGWLFQDYFCWLTSQRFVARKLETSTGAANPLFFGVDSLTILQDPRQES